MEKCKTYWWELSFLLEDVIMFSAKGVYLLLGYVRLQRIITDTQLYFTLI